MGVTIKQIAEMAGVHRSTVDKVLHKRPGVSDDVRKKVQKIIDENNYEANPIGKALKMQNRELRTVPFRCIWSFRSLPIPMYRSRRIYWTGIVRKRWTASF